jgi:hypothetical protein
MKDMISVPGACGGPLVIRLVITTLARDVTSAKEACARLYWLTPRDYLSRPMAGLRDDGFTIGF